jgi:GTP cyclohydrolase I
MSEVIRERINKSRKKADRRFFANDNISQFLEPGDLERLTEELTLKMEGVLDTLVIDRFNDHNSEGTAARVAKMFINELYAGRYQPMPRVTDFPNVSNLDQVYCVGPVHINSACSHHMVPIVGKAWIGVFPSNRVIGLSKFHRLANWINRRPQIQEESTNQLADVIEAAIKPQGLAVLVKARHFCCGMRGVMDPDTWMTTSVMRGAFRDSETMKREFLQLVQMSDK